MSQYHAIVSLSERDVKTSLLMHQRPQESDNIHMSDESYVPMCKGSDHKKLSPASPGGRMRAGPSRTHASGRKRTWHIVLPAWRGLDLVLHRSGDARACLIDA